MQLCFKLNTFGVHFFVAAIAKSVLALPAPLLSNVSLAFNTKIPLFQSPFEIRKIFLEGFTTQDTARQSLNCRGCRVSFCGISGVFILLEFCYLIQKFPNLEERAGR